MWYNGIMKTNTIYKIDDPYAFLTKELLEEEYIQNGLSDKKIAEKYNIGSKVTVWKRRKFHKVANRCKNKSNNNARKNRKFNVSKEQALTWLAEGKSYEEMAGLVGCSRMVLYRRLKELGFVTECNQAMNHLRWYERLTDLQIRFLMGDLLGDGSINLKGMYQCNHSHRQKQFIEYKQEVLQSVMSPNFELKESSVYNNQNGKSYRKYYLRTMSNKGLKKIYNAFYKDNVKIFPDKYLRASTFDSYSLAAWYMGDGGRRNNVASIYTFGFGYKSNLEILSFLNDRFDIKGSMVEDRSADRNEDKNYSICFKKEEADKFFTIVSPHILPYFQYKLPEK